MESLAPLSDTSNIVHERRHVPSMAIIAAVYPRSNITRLSLRASMRSSMADADFCCPMFPVYRSERLRKGRSRRVFIAPRGVPLQRLKLITKEAAPTRLIVIRTRGDDCRLLHWPLLLLLPLHGNLSFLLGLAFCQFFSARSFFSF